MTSVGWVDGSNITAAAPALESPIKAVQKRIREQVSKIGKVLCQVDAADGSPSFDLKEVASQNEAQMANILQTVSAHLNSLDKQFHAQKDDAAFGEVLQAMEEGLFHHRQQAFQMLSSALLECKREEALFLSGTLKACSDFRAEAGQMRVVVRDHRNAMACRTSTMIEAQHRCKDLHEEHELQAASFLEQHAELSSALDNSSCEVEQSMQQCLQVLDSVQDMSRCSLEAAHAPMTELTEEVISASHELHTDASTLRSAVQQRAVDAQLESEQHTDKIRRLEEEQERSLMQLEEREVLLSKAAEAECTLQRCLAEAEADAATWRIAAQHGLSQGESRSLELAEAHEAELSSLKGAIQGLCQQNEEMQAELQLLRGREQQHLIDLEQAQDSMSDLGQAAQQTEECHSLMCSAALESAASCRKDLRGLYAFAGSALASMADDLAARVHDMPGLLAGATAELSATEVTNKPSRPHDPAEEGSGEGEVPASVVEELREQLSALAADCLEAQRLRDHWHSQYTAQAESSVLAQMQLQRRTDTASKECEELRSRLDAQAASSAEADQKHAADLDAYKEQAQLDWDALQAALEGSWQEKRSIAVSVACEHLQKQHDTQLHEHAASLSAQHIEELDSMRDAHLLERRQLQAELLQLQKRHQQELQHEQEVCQLREDSLVETHAIALRDLAEEHDKAVSKAAADATEHLQDYVVEAGARCRRLLDEQAEDHKTELAAAQSSGEQQVAEAHIRLQSMSQECREQREATERRLQGSEQATSALKAAHEKTLRKTMAQHARKASEAEQMQKAAAEMLAHHQQLAALEHDRHTTMHRNMQAELQRKSADLASRERRHEAELASNAADMAALTQQHASAQRQAAESLQAQLATASLEHAQRLQQVQEAAEKQSADADERLQDIKDLLLALQARFNNREARPMDLEAVKALEKSMRQKDAKLEELCRQLADMDLSRQQLQDEMHLREKHWLANGNMRIGPSLDGSPASPGKAASRKSNSHIHR